MRTPAACMDNLAASARIMLVGAPPPPTFASACPCIYAFAHAQALPMHQTETQPARTCMRSEISASTPIATPRMPSGC